MNKQRVLASVATIEVAVADLKRAVVTNTLHHAGLLALADGIRKEANEIGNECWMDAMRQTLSYRSWGERGGQRSELVAERSELGTEPAGALDVAEGVEKMIAPAVPAEAAAPAAPAAAPARPAGRLQGLRTRDVALSDLLPLGDFVCMREEGLAYDQIAQRVGVSEPRVVAYGKRVLPRELVDLRRGRKQRQALAEGGDGEELDEREEDGE